MTTVKPYLVSAVKAYKQVQSEEGPYEAFCGYNIVASVDNGEYIHSYLLKDAEFPFLFKTEPTTLIENILSKGMRLQHWLEVKIDKKNALPDYVDNWWKPEYN